MKRRIFSSTEEVTETVKNRFARQLLRNLSHNNNPCYFRNYSSKTIGNLISDFPARGFRACGAHRDRLRRIQLVVASFPVANIWLPWRTNGRALSCQHRSPHTLRPRESVRAPAEPSPSTEGPVVCVGRRRHTPWPRPSRGRRPSLPLCLCGCAAVRLECRAGCAPQTTCEINGNGSKSARTAGLLPKQPSWNSWNWKISSQTRSI